MQTWLDKNQLKRCTTHQLDVLDNLVDRVYDEITRQQICRGVYKSVAERGCHQTWLTERNDKPKRFKWSDKAKNNDEKNASEKSAMEEEVEAIKKKLVTASTSASAALTSGQ